jgi:hypothetical protein
MRLSEKPTAIRLGVGQLEQCELLAAHYEKVMPGSSWGSADIIRYALQTGITVLLAESGKTDDSDD